MKVFYSPRHGCDGDDGGDVVVVVEVKEIRDFYSNMYTDPESQNINFSYFLSTEDWEFDSFILFRLPLLLSGVLCCPYQQRDSRGWSLSTPFHRTEVLALISVSSGPVWDWGSGTASHLLELPCDFWVTAFAYFRIFYKCLQASVSPLLPSSQAALHVLQG